MGQDFVFNRNYVNSIKSWIMMGKNIKKRVNFQIMLLKRARMDNTVHFFQHFHFFQIFIKQSFFLNYLAYVLKLFFIIDSYYFNMLIIFQKSKNYLMQKKK